MSGVIVPEMNVLPPEEVEEEWFDYFFPTPASPNDLVSTFEGNLRMNDFVYASIDDTKIAVDENALAEVV